MPSRASFNKRKATEVVEGIRQQAPATHSGRLQGQDEATAAVTERQLKAAATKQKRAETAVAKATAKAKALAGKEVAKRLELPPPVTQPGFGDQQTESDNENFQPATKSSKKALCGRHLWGQFAVKDNGQLLACKGGKGGKACPFTHVILKDYTRKGMLARMESIPLNLRAHLTPAAKAFTGYKA
jgi:hypothetical protein